MIILFQKYIILQILAIKKIWYLCNEKPKQWEYHVFLS